MKSSELKKLIKEEIRSTLTEDKGRDLAREIIDDARNKMAKRGIESFEELESFKESLIYAFFDSDTYKKIYG